MAFSAQKHIFRRLRSLENIKAIILSLVKHAERCVHVSLASLQFTLMAVPLNCVHFHVTAIDSNEEVFHVGIFFALSLYLSLHFASLSLLCILKAD